MTSRTHIPDEIWHSSSFGNERRDTFAISKVVSTDRKEKRWTKERAESKKDQMSRCREGSEKEVKRVKRVSEEKGKTNT